MDDDQARLLTEMHVAAYEISRVFWGVIDAQRSAEMMARLLILLEVAANRELEPYVQAMYLGALAAVGPEVK